MRQVQKQIQTENFMKKLRHSQREIAGLVSVRCRKTCVIRVEDDSLMFKIVIHRDISFQTKEEFFFLRTIWYIHLPFTNVLFTTFISYYFFCALLFVLAH
jgi:hypothetical protein